MKTTQSTQLGKKMKKSTSPTVRAKEKQVTTTKNIKSN